MILGSAPLQRQLLSPAGFPLEQLSVTVSVGKSLKYRLLMSLELLRKAWPWTQHQTVLSDEDPLLHLEIVSDVWILRTSHKICKQDTRMQLEMSGFAVYSSFLNVQESPDLNVVVLQTQNNPGQTFNLPSEWFLSTADLSPRSRGFWVMSLLSMKDGLRSLSEQPASCCEHWRCCTFLLVHITAEIWSSWSSTSLVTGDSKGLTLLSFN